MKKVWNAKYRNGTGSARVYGTDADDAKKSAYALYTYTGAMSTKNFGIDEIVESVELAEDQVMRGNAVHQQVEYTADDQPRLRQDHRRRDGIRRQVAQGEAARGELCARLKT